MLICNLFGENKLIKIKKATMSGLFIISVSITAMGDVMENLTETYTIPENCNFEAVTGQFISNPCTPKILDRKFRGIVINAPRDVFYESGNQEPFGGFAFIPICGTFKEANGEPPEEGILNSLVLVAVDTASKQVYSGKYEEPGLPEPMPPDLASPAKFWPDGTPIDNIPSPPGTVVSGGSFNFNLAEVVNLPAKPADYIVYVTAGPIKSNVRTIKVREKM